MSDADLGIHAGNNWADGGYNLQRRARPSCGPSIMSERKLRFWVTLSIAFALTSCDHAINARLIGTNRIEISDIAPGDLKKDSFSITHATIDNTSLYIVASSGGGCREHSYTLTMTPSAFMESFPVQANIYLRHDAKDDPCDAIVTDSVVFDLRPIVTLYQQMYGPNGQVNLNLFNFEQTESTRLELQVR